MQQQSDRRAERCLGESSQRPLTAHRPTPPMSASAISSAACPLPRRRTAHHLGLVLLGEARACHLGNHIGEMSFRIGLENPEKSVRVRADQIPKIG